MDNLVFLDTETTGLDPDWHDIWEVAAIIDGEEFTWQLPVSLPDADPTALRIGRFHERRAEITDPNFFASAFAKMTAGKHLVGAVVSFDEERLRMLLKANGECPEWHYHLVDVEAFAAGALGRKPPWDSEELSLALSIVPSDYDKHTALGDARWAKAIYEAVIARGPNG